MQDRPPIVDGAPLKPGRSGGALRPGGADVALWHWGWSLGAVAGAALLLLAVGGVSDQILLGLALMAAPGVMGGLWRPSSEEALSLVAVWAIAAVAAVTALGGLEGPLAVLCLAPVIACLAIGASWRGGVVLSLAAAILCALLGLVRLAPPQPFEPARTWLSLIALGATAAAAGGAFWISHRRAEIDRQALHAELVAFQTLMGELPELAVAMDAQGRTEAVFGQALPGMLLDALHKGLAEVAAPADRGAVQAAISEAMDHGAATVQFILAGGGQAVVTSLQRTRVGGLTAILRPASAAPSDETIGRPDASLSAADVARRLSEADAARRHAEAERDRAEANAKARTRFVANMSHELRTPLNAIMGFSDMMRTKVFGELAPKYAEYADLIHESGGHLLDLINDVLDMSKIDADRYVLSREVFDIREPLNAALRLIRLQADDAGVKLRAILPSEPLVVDADRRALKQVVLNLLSNAVKFTPKDGTVILTVRAALDAPSVLEIIVADTGVGIAKDDLQRLGRPFEQAGDMDQRGRGTGLGLALVAAFAKLHGGVLVLESRLGEGTAATVRLPALLATKTASSDGTRELTDAAAEPLDLKPAAEPHGTILQPAPVSPGAPLGFRVGEAGTDQSTSPRLTLVHSAPLSASLGPAAFSPKPGAQFDEVPPA